MSEADPPYSSFIVNCVFNAFSTYSAIMLNILTIHAIRKTSSLSKPLKTLLLSLAVSDLGVGLLAQPLYIAWMVNPTSSTTALDIITTLFVNVSFFLVVAISVDRFLAIQLHLRYQELVTHKRLVAVVISIWTMSVPSSPLIFLLRSKKPFRVLMAVIVGFCFIFAGSVYSRMFFTARHHANQIQILQMQVAHNQGQAESTARKRKSAISMFYVYLVFLVCYLPQYCVKVAGFIQSSPSTALHSVHLYSQTLMFLNSSLNPVIYGWKMRHIRHAKIRMIDILRNLFPKQNQANL